MRVGWIHHAELPFDFKHPIIMRFCHSKKNTSYPNCLLLDLHLKILHSRREQILLLSTDIFWITNEKKLAKSIIQNCLSANSKMLNPRYQ